MNPFFLRANLCFLHGTMTASEGLLKNAIAHANGKLKIYFDKHLAEETGHLGMLEADLQRLGVTDIVKFPAAAQLAGAQYYYIMHEHPAMLLGYMSAMESSTPSIADVNAVEAEHGPLYCVRHHALHDVGHALDLREQIDRLDPALKRRVSDNEAWTLHDIRTRIIPMINFVANQFSRH